MTTSPVCIYLDPPSISLRAVTLAEQFQRPNTYDTHYLALAEHLNCPFWTADERLYNAVQTSGLDIHWLGQFPEHS